MRTQKTFIEFNVTTIIIKLPVENVNLTSSQTAFSSCSDTSDFSYASFLLYLSFFSTAAHTFTQNSGSATAGASLRSFLLSLSPLAFSAPSCKNSPPLIVIISR
ncbi:hypothetical protein KP509_06G039800 [Ceratopteris richardii]|uniref:Uncharacterized protein n=1 Tax=Ceratopteris richardii TaxID=49495 RepID=A0A8T2UK30_CERRI|nr:hypothetical protein KP509_06G039800 [Ceratopteris richardii]